MKRILACFLFAFITFSLQGNIHMVGKSQRYHSIKTALEQAAAGDTIMIHAGHYSEGNMVIKKPVVIIGKNRPVLDGGGKFEIFTIASPHVTVEGLKFINSGKSSINDLAGIKCLDAHYITIQNNIFENTFFGIHLSNSDFSVIKNNQLTSRGENEYELGNGIHLWKCNNAGISGNTIRGHRDGIYFEFVTKSNIINNISDGNKRYGLHFMFSHQNSYESNIFKNNGAGVAVMYTRFVIMKNNRFEQNWGPASYGLLLKDITDSEVLNNEFTGNTSAIYMEGVSRTVFQFNDFKLNGWAVKLQASCDGNSFLNNNFRGNTFDIATNGSLVLNKIDRNYWDKYSGYDLNRDGTGDIPHHPVSLFSMIVESVPPAMLLWRSFLVFLLDKAEKIIPAITPENLKDNFPEMRPYDIR